jgi:hypothetical protein
MHNITYSFPYIFFFIYVYILNFSVGIKGCNIAVNIKIVLFFTGCIIFLGFRGYIYTDWVSYYVFFTELPTLFDLFDDSELYKYIEGAYWEKGFILYSIILKTISSNYFFYQCFSLIIDHIILYFFFKKYTQNHIILGFVLYYIFGGLEISINLLRNVKSIMLFLISIKYCREQRIAPYILLNALGSLFHIISLLYIPLYFILNRNIPQKITLLVFIAGNVFYLLEIQWIKEILTAIQRYMSSKLGHLITVYLQAKAYSGSYGLTIGYIERQISFVIIYCFSSRLKEKSDYNTIFLNLFYIYIFIFLFCSEMLIFLSRVALIFILGYWVLYPQIYFVLSKKRKYIFIILLTVYSILKLMSATSSIICAYDNALFYPQSIEYRKMVLQRFLVNEVK